MLPKMENATEESMGDLSNPMVMRTYYSRLLPWKTMFLWLNQSHAPTRQFTHREFAFTLQNEAYLRYQSFSTAEELKHEVLRLNPSRFEIGPMYSGRVSLLALTQGFREPATDLALETAKGSKSAHEVCIPSAHARTRL